MTVNVAIVSTDVAARLALVRSLEAGPPEWVLGVYESPPPTADVIVCSPETDIAGAVVVDPSAPGDVIARVTDAAAPRPRVVAVTSLDGGSGVTTLGLHVAAAVSSLQVATAFVDLDPNRGAHHRLGIAPEGSNHRAIPCAGGFRFVADADPTVVVGDETRNAACVVVDIPGARLDRVSDRVDVGLLLVRPTPAGARRAREMVDAYPALVWCPVVNRLGRGGQTTIAQVARTVGGRVFELPPCPALRDVEDEDRLLLSRWTRWSRRVGLLAEAIAG